MNFFQSIINAILSLFGSRRIKALPLPKSQNEIFLAKGTGYWPACILSDHYNDNQIGDMIAMKKNHGCNAWWPIAYNEGDYGKLDVSFYADKYGGTVDPNKVKMMRSRLERVVKEGFAVVLWLITDDSPGSAKADLATRLRHVKNCVDNFGDLCSGYVVGLELQETTSVDYARAIAQELKKLDPKKSIGTHEVPKGTIYAQSIPEVDTHYHQYGFGKNTAQIEAETKRVIGLLPGKKVIAAEYHMDGTTMEAKALGQAAMRAGASGTGNGR